MGFLPWEEGSGNKEFGVRGVERSVSGFCKVVTCFKSGVTLKGLRGVENNLLRSKILVCLVTLEPGCLSL